MADNNSPDYKTLFLQAEKRREEAEERQKQEEERRKNHNGRHGEIGKRRNSGKNKQ
jgi:hypothetical protein